MPTPPPPLPPVVRTGEQPAVVVPAAQWRPITVHDVIAGVAYTACAVVMICCLVVMVGGR